MYEVRRFRDREGRDVVGEWLAGLRDIRARARVLARVARLEAGNFGDCKPLRDGVCELRIDYGPGYRVYYGLVGKTVVLLLCGGDKRTQGADIDRAVASFGEFKGRVRG